MIAVIDDEESIRKSLLRLISAEGHSVCGFASAEEFLESGQVQKTSCVVADLQMRGMSGLDLQTKLARAFPHLSIVFITGRGSIPASVLAMKEGAVDFLEKPAQASAIFAAIERALQRTRSLTAKGEHLTALRDRFEMLTPREREVFALVTTGLLNKQVGAQLGTSEKTIKQHRGRVMDKMGADSLASLVMMAEELGIRSVGTDFSEARGRIVR
jgi:FixJ family two-component response regulator